MYRSLYNEKNFTSASASSLRNTTKPHDPPTGQPWTEMDEKKCHTGQVYWEEIEARPFELSHRVGRRRFAVA